MNICLSSGHSLKVRGASGEIDEVDEARKVVERVAELLGTAGVGATVFHDNTSTSVSSNLNAIVSFHNSRNRDLDVSIHFNAFQKTTKAMGTECLYVSQQALAARIATAVANNGGFINRGAKKRTDLAFLNRTNKPAVLIEVCFVDSSSDVALYKKNFLMICCAIAESVSGVRIPGETAPAVPPSPPPPLAPELPSGENVVDVALTIQGNVLVTINGDPVNEVTGTAPNRLALTLEDEGDVLVTVDGEDFQVHEPPAPLERPTLRKGARGNDVRVVQEVLNAKHVDGIFGTITETAVKTFQREQNLQADGIVGPQTWAALGRVYGLPDSEPALWQNNIIATVFGGTADPGTGGSAYPPFSAITDTELSVALPFKFQGDRPKVRVINRANGKDVLCNIRDVGPWLLDDDYFYNGERPLAEQCWRDNQGLPRGPHKGRIPNGAGIDLSPATAKALGISGKGNVDWHLE